jgi:hypothetical protein
VKEDALTSIETSMFRALAIVPEIGIEPAALQWDFQTNAQ